MAWCWGGLGQGQSHTSLLLECNPSCLHSLTTPLPREARPTRLPGWAPSAKMITLGGLVRKEWMDSQMA